MERVSRSRCIAILLLFAVVLSLFGFRMYGLQVRDVDPDSNRDATYTTWSRVTAARGEILDRNGNVLVTNRASYNLVFNNYVIYNSDNPNESLRKLANLLQERGIAYLEHLPVTLDKPYEYTLSELSSTWQGYFKDFFELPGVGFRHFCGPADEAAAQCLSNSQRLDGPGGAVGGGTAL